MKVTKIPISLRRENNIEREIVIRENKDFFFWGVNETFEIKLNNIPLNSLGHSICSRFVAQRLGEFCHVKSRFLSVKVASTDPLSLSCYVILKNKA